ncbi:MAG: protein kinase [Planctomycetota bacterium]
MGPRPSTDGDGKGAELMFLPPVVQRRYRHRQELGAGGMGKVSLVDDLIDGVPRALKWVTVEEPASAMEQRHLREFRILSELDHPNIVGVDAYGIVPGQFRYYTCEHLRGPALQTVIDKQRLTPQLATTVLVQLLRALSRVHALGWVHGDVKPENLLFREPLADTPPELCLIDFGLAHPERRPCEERVLGTVYYMAPEQILGARADGRADLYAVGVLAYQLFTGRLPFHSRERFEVLEAHVRTLPTPPRKYVPDLPPELEEVILSLLEKKPADRPTSANETLRQLHTACGIQLQPETTATTLSYLRGEDATGWEDPLQLALGTVLQRSGGARELAVTWESPLAEAGDRAYHSLPLRPQEGGATKVGMVLVRSAVAGDVDAARQMMRRRLECAGVPVIDIDAGGTPILDLVSGILARLPEPLRATGQGYQRLTAPLADGDLGADELVDWLTVVGRDYPIAIFVDRFEIAAEPLCRLLSAIARAEEDNADLRQVSWVGWQQEAASLIVSHWLQGSEGVHWCQPLGLPPLDLDGLGRWLARRFGDWHLPAPLRRLLEEESEGSPSLLQSALESLVEEGLLVKGWDGWSLTQSDGLDGSPRVQATIHGIRELSPEDRELLTGLAALGGSGDLEWMRRITGSEITVLVPAIRRLRDLGWITAELEGRRFRFRTVFARKAVESCVPPQRWRELNTEVAAWLREREAAGFRVCPERLARHLLAASNGVDAATIVDAAARQALQEGRVLAGIRWLERLLEIPGLQISTIVDAFDRLAELRQRWGPSDEVARLRRQAVEWSARLSGAVELHGSLLAKLGAHLGRGGDFSAAAECVKQVLKQLRGQPGAAPNRASLLLGIELQLQRGVPVELPRLWAAVDALPAATDGTLLGWEAWLRAETSLLTGQRDVARRHLEEGVRKLDGDTGVAASGWCVQLLARLRDLIGMKKDAIRHHRLAARVFARCGVSHRQGCSFLHMGSLTFASGDLGEAEELLLRAERIFDRTGSKVELPRVYWLQGELLARGGWVLEAGRRFALCRRWTRQYPHTPWGWEALLSEAAIATRRGQLDRAVQLLRGKAHPSQAPHADQPGPWMRWGEIATAAALKGGDPAGALTLNLHTLQEIRPRGDRRHQAPFWRMRLTLLERFGCRTEAAELRHRLEKQGAAGGGDTPAPEASEEVLLRRGDQEALARHYVRAATAAFQSGERARGLFFLEEAEFHARRLRAVPLVPLIEARLAVIRAREDSAVTVEATLIRCWRSLARCGVHAGRVELLLLWATAREDAGDLRAAECLRAAAHGRAQRFTQRIPGEADANAAYAWMRNAHGCAPPESLLTT